MTPEGTPDHQLHKFLTAARARLRPEDIGIRPAGNRRGGGLHQSDLADALVVSDRWYNGFENGARPPSRYDAVVSRLGELLRLTPAERLYLHLLATGHEPPPPVPDLPDVPASGSRVPGGVARVRARLRLSHRARPGAGRTQAGQPAIVGASRVGCNRGASWLRSTRPHLRAAGGCSAGPRRCYGIQAATRRPC
jgi:hypothetical protein